MHICEVLFADCAQTTCEVIAVAAVCSSKATTRMTFGVLGSRDTASLEGLSRARMDVLHISLLIVVPLSEMLVLQWGQILVRFLTRFRQ
jgi:hypothetical protein